MQPSCHIFPRPFATRCSVLAGSVVGLAVVCLSVLAGLSAPAVAAPAPPAAPVSSLVPVTDASLQVTPSEATVVATVGWNTNGVVQGLVVGGLHVVAVDASTRLPKLVATKNTPVTGAPETYTFHITDPALLPALAAGNRVVITATQHKRTVGTAFTQPIYATVHELQPGPSRGAVGRLDCSARPILGNSSYNNCNFTGAVLIQRSLPGSQLEEADFTGASLAGAALSGSNMAGASLARHRHEPDDEHQSVRRLLVRSQAQHERQLDPQQRQLRRGRAAGCQLLREPPSTKPRSSRTR